MDYPLLIAIFPQVLLDGLILGFMYALIALGYTMVYGVLEFINFAHSEIFVGGLCGGRDPPGSRRGSWMRSPFLVLLILLFWREWQQRFWLHRRTVAYRPPRGGPGDPVIPRHRGPFFRCHPPLREHLAMPSTVYPTMDQLNLRFQLTENIEISVKSLVVIASALLMLWALHLIVNRTKVGKAIRAVAEDQATASLMGINVNRMISLTFLIGGAMGGAAGVLFGVQYSLINPYTGFIPGLKAFTAAVLGGIGNIPGAMMGGLVLGLLEAFAASYLSLLTGGAFGAEYKDIFAFSILILILIFRPKGLLGEVVRERA
jgi:branched-chain amino acid transport system permease protein